MTTQIKHLYFVPGLSASPKIFEFIQLPKDQYQVHFLEWLMPLSVDESIENYALRMVQLVTEEPAVLVGVSFGGIVVQEMSKHLRVRKIILISSVKCRAELPKRLKVLYNSKAYKLFPAKAIKNVEGFFMYTFGDFAKNRIDMYKKYLTVRNEKYLMWAIYNVLSWEQLIPQENILHIHGTSDSMFPIKHIKKCIPIKNGTHVMILNKAKTISNIIIKHLEC